MSPSRRGFLRSTGVAGLASLAGCGELPSLRPDLTVFLLNRDDESQRLHLEFLREDRVERSEAFVYSRTHRLDSRDDSDDTPPESFVVESRPYLVRVDLLGRADIPRRHYHYHPDCGGSSVPDELYVELRPFDGRLGFEFVQNTCGGDSLRY